PLTPVQAAALYERFIRDTFANLRTIDAGIDLFAAVAPESDPGLLRGVVPGGAAVFSQSGDGLGERISSVFDTLFARGYNRVVVIGSDSPDMPCSTVTEALALLGDGSAQLVLGPADDGGYFLVALSEPLSAPFEGIPWSTGAVLEATLQRAREAGIPVALTSGWHDIDRGEDIELLRANPSAPLSSAYLASIGFGGPRGDRAGG
ncbi:MAG: TIGR04282 family arsenosugar biosynthesis glycosyltransferase, partial [Thermodesulfobacteriota bacterium]